MRPLARARAAADPVTWVAAWAGRTVHGPRRADPAPPASWPSPSCARRPARRSSRRRLRSPSGRCSSSACATSRASPSAASSARSGPGSRATSPSASPGKVASRLVNVGDRVKAGQALATLDEADLRLQREQAEAEKACRGAASTQAQAELKRIQTLVGEGWSTAATLERQQAVTEEARGRLARAERALSLGRERPLLRDARRRRGRRGHGDEVEPGQVVATDRPAMRLARTGEKEAVVAMPETLIGHGAAAAGRRMTLWSNPGRRYEARLRELSPSADAATRTYLARFALPRRRPRGPARHDGDDRRRRRRRRPGSRACRSPRSTTRATGPAVWVVEPGRPPGAAAGARSRPTRPARCWSPAASRRATRSSRSASRSSTPPSGCGIVAGACHGSEVVCSRARP